MNEKENTASNRVNTVEIKRLIPVDDAKYNIERVHLKNRRTKKQEEVQHWLFQVLLRNRKSHW